MMRLISLNGAQRIRIFLVLNVLRTKTTKTAIELKWVWRVVRYWTWAWNIPWTSCMNTGFSWKMSWPKRNLSKRWLKWPALFEMWPVSVGLLLMPKQILIPVYVVRWQKLKEDLRLEKLPGWSEGQPMIDIELELERYLGRVVWLAQMKITKIVIIKSPERR
jgi:hypothetical protein